DRRVEELVDDRVGERHRWRLSDGREERVGEPAERAEGDGRTHLDVETTPRQALARRLGLAALEEALVRHPPDDRVPPGGRREQGDGADEQAALHGRAAARSAGSAWPPYCTR